MSFLFNTIFYIPIYNGLIVLLNIIPWANVGVAVILLTCLVKVILLPLSKKASIAQIEMKNLEPQLQEIKNKYKDNKQEQAAQTMKLYKEKKINPFSGAGLMLVQLPVLLALYYVFLKGGLPTIHHELLYPFVKAPSIIGMGFLGMDVGAKSIIFAVIAAVAQFLQIQLITPPTPKKQDKEKSSFKDDLARSMSLQMKYVMPIIIFIIAKSFPMVVSLYLITSSVFTILQELYIKRQYNKEQNGQK